MQRPFAPFERWFERPTSTRRRSVEARTSRRVLALVLALAAPASLPSVAAAAAWQEELAITAEEAELIDLDRRRGKLNRALDDLEEILEEVPGDPISLVLRARGRFEACDYEGAESDARAAFVALRTSDRATTKELGVAARELATLLVALGRADEALVVLGDAGGAIQPATDARDAWVRGRAHLERGARAAAMADFAAGAVARGERTWDTLLAQGRCQRALGRFREAASTLVAADALAKEGLGVEPDVLTELGELYFEVYGEVNDAMSRAHSPEKLYEEALRLHPEHEAARLGLFELHRFNWRLTRRSTEEILAEVFAARPRSVAGALARTSAALDDGNLVVAREALDLAESVAPARRDVRAERAALTWIEGGEAECRRLLAELLDSDPADPRPERVVGKHLLELYRFAEGLDFLERAVERDPRDWLAWTELGRAQANTGDEDAARASLARATHLAEGRRNAWRDNTLLVLQRMEQTMVEHRDKDLTFAWRPDAAAVLERYLVPFYASAREELSERYGFTPGPVRIEVFRSWNDFSVRSTGFEGFPALGVCFGPVVTAVSPLAELRGAFSWARTSYHEFTHVVHLGLSHNRCPRWVTEGLATWEEGEANPAWWRNLRREMVDARANGEIEPIRRLNAAFRGPRVVFAYYQSGLLCKMLIEEHGFAPMVRLLEAFDSGADLDEALQRVFARTPEELDAAFRSFVDTELRELAIEPRWSRASTVRLRFRLSRTPPQAGDGQGDAEALAEWVDGWCRVAWGAYWARELVDAAEALRVARTGGELPPRGLFLAAEMALARGEVEAARRGFERGFAAGGEDYRARMALASILIGEEEFAQAEVQLVAAERAFPGYDEPRFSAELRLAELYALDGREEEAQAARVRWLGWNAGDYDVRVDVASWLSERGRHAEAERLWREANEVDPFRRHLHLEWGKSLAALGRHAEAVREFEVGLLVPEDLDLDVQLARGLAAAHPMVTAPDELLELAGAEPAEELPGDVLSRRWETEAPELHGQRALSLLELGRTEDARAAVAAALELDADCAPALEAQARLD